MGYPIMAVIIPTDRHHGSISTSNGVYTVNIFLFMSPLLVHPVPDAALIHKRLLICRSGVRMAYQRLEPEK